jgi:lambda family phage tail tape measure protein
LLLNQALADRTEILDEVQAPQIELERGVQALNSLFADGLIDLTQYNRKLRELQQSALSLDTTVQGGLQRGLLGIHEQFTDLSQIAEQGLVNAFQGAEDALVSFVQTGKLSFRSLVDSIYEDMIRLAVRSAITGPIAGLLAPSSDGGGAGGMLSSLFSAVGQGGGSTAAAGGTGSSGTLEGLASLAGLFGYKNGGDFTIGGSGGPDSQLVQFMGSPGEEVHINKPGQAGSKGTNVNFYIQTPDVDSFQRSQGQLLAKTQAAMSRASSRNN